MAGRTPDRRPGVEDQEGSIYESNTPLATQIGEVRYNSTSDRFSMFDGTGEFDPNSAAGADVKDAKVTVADTTPGFLDAKITVSGDLNKVILNPGANEQLELGVVVGSIFSVGAIQQQALKQTTLQSPQDAFTGSSLSPALDGDYLVFFEGITRVTNNNGKMQLAVGLNGINAQAGSERPYEGNSSGSTISIFRINGLVTADTIHGTYQKTAGSGQATLTNRSLTIMRVG